MRANEKADEADNPGERDSVVCAILGDDSDGNDLDDCTIFISSTTPEDITPEDITISSNLEVTTITSEFSKSPTAVDEVMTYRGPPEGPFGQEWPTGPQWAKWQ